MLSIIQAAGWPIWPLILCSVLALAFIVERFISLKPARVLTPGLVDEAIEVSRNAVPTPDTVNQLEQHSALGGVLAAGWRAINTNPRCTAADTTPSSRNLRTPGRRAPLTCTHAVFCSSPTST